MEGLFRGTGFGRDGVQVWVSQKDAKDSVCQLWEPVSSVSNKAQILWVLCLVVSPG